jgi:hypothetical protein
MFDEPNEEPKERSFSPADRARDKSDEFRMHAELAAVFEGCRKFDAQLLPGLDAKFIREIQRGMATLDKSKIPDTPVIADESSKLAAKILGDFKTEKLSTNDYHIHRRPGEVMIARWLVGDQVATYYERIQAHFDAAMNGFRTETRQNEEWKQDPATLAYLDALDAVKVNMSEKYARQIIKNHRIFILSTQSADEMNIEYLCQYIMGITIPQLVGSASAPPDEPSEQDLAWFFKLFSLRGMVEGIEHMCFFAFLQKSDDMI